MFARETNLNSGAMRLGKRRQTMKNQIANAMSRSVRSGSVLTALLLLGLGTAASSTAGILPPTSRAYGISYPEWSAKWWQWSLEQSTNHLEVVGKPDFCDGEASRVRFLMGAYLTGGAAIVTNKITISTDTPLFFPVLSVWDDNTGCPTFTAFTADQLAAQVAALWTGVTLTTCTIDGVPVPGLSNPATSEYLVQAPPFSYTTAPEGNVLAGIFGDACIDGGTFVYPAVADGVYLMLSPLAPGKHTIHTVGQVSTFVDLDITYDITVERDGGRNDDHR